VGWRDRLARGPDARRIVVAGAAAVGLHLAALVLLTASGSRPPGPAPDGEGTLVHTEVVAQAVSGPALPPRSGQVVESVGAAKEAPPTSETSRIAERNASTEVESRRGASAREPGQRARSPQPARLVQEPGPSSTTSEAPGGLAILVPDAGAVAQAAADAGSSASAAADPGGAPAGITLDLAEHADDELSDVPLGDSTQLRAHASSYAGFINGVRDRVRRVWRVREVYQEADPSHRFPGNALVTEVAVRLQADGKVARATVLRGSGLSEVDEEATAVLSRAGPFTLPAGILDPDGSFSFQFSFTFDLTPLRFLTATRQALLDRWRPSRAFRQVGDRERVTTVRLLLERDGVVARIHPVASAGVDFLDSGALAALKTGDRLPVPPDSLVRTAEGQIPLWVEFRHRVGRPSDVRVMRRYRPPE
jgi:TonB family protein